MGRVVNISRAKVTHPNGEVINGRFVFLNGKAAVWVENKQERTAHRVLYASDATYVPRRTAREPNLLQIDDDEVWQVTQISGGCGCGAVSKRYTFAQLLDPNLDHIG